MTTNSVDEARQLLSQIINLNELIDCLWKTLDRYPEPQRSLAMAITRMPVNDGGQFTATQMYNAIEDSDPQLLEGANINTVESLAKEDLSAYHFHDHGFLLIDNVVRQMFQRYFPVVSC
ncbi:uncharacterized protein N7529_010305 [Penicillium soppii]|jgi:hypothetical protein|uniref:uncharacterized protein n=1 Tax=Penicillium soppii TaxID=69789 RepID=UPI0025478EF3|nr:uncharacterized protein N7529_010305 [Penicillium soppii]KAJ5856361.1 hypothetical protein N7529_010305 [Penicillium soppii]